MKVLISCLVYEQFFFGLSASQRLYQVLDFQIVCSRASMKKHYLSKNASGGLLVREGFTSPVASTHIVLIEIACNSYTILEMF